MSVQSKSLGKRLPVIDISPLLKADLKTSSNEVCDIVKQIDQALRDSGLFYITGHGVPENVTNEVMDATRRFFEMPVEKKMALNIRNSKAYRGYIQEGSEKSGGKVDAKEGIYFGPDDPDVTPSIPMVGPNQYPDERDLPGFATVVKQYRDQMKTVGVSLMRAIAMGLKLKPDFFDDMFSNPSTWLALWSYPVQPCQEGSWGAWTHTDPEVLTMIVQDDVGGLEIQFPDGEWVDAPPIPGAFTVNAGDSLEIWTKGLYRAGIHRVRSSRGKQRFSAPFFLGPSLKSVIEPLDIDLTRDIKYNPASLRRKLPCSYGDYYIVSFKTSYEWFKG